MIDLEGRLIDGLSGEHLVNGHDVGSGEMNVFVHTSDPDLACSEVRHLMNEDEQKQAIIAVRPFESDEYAVLWPHDQNTFSIS
jgi:hypothetical protein